MAFLPNRMDMDNRWGVPMFRARPSLITLPRDFHRVLPYQAATTELFSKSSRFFPELTSMRIEDSRLKLKISVYGYKHEDIKIEVVDKFLVIHAKYEERKEKDCFVSREFKRRFYLTEYVIDDKVSAKWSPLGWLTVYMPLKAHPPQIYSTKGGRRPMQNGVKPIKPKKVRPVAIMVAER